MIPSTFSTLAAFLKSNVTQTYESKSAKQLERPPSTFCHNFLDEFCGGAYTQQLAVLYGEQVCQTIAEQLCVRVQLPIESGGLNARSVFIDGGNTFDVYHVSDYAAALHLDRDKVLRGINVSRAFTCYQLVNLIVEKLPKLLRDQRIGVVVISNFLDLFMDSEVDLNETKHAINFLSGFLAKCARENRIALVITCPAHEDSEDDLFRQFLTSRAQIVLRAERRGRKVVFDLERHPAERVTRHLHVVE